MCMEYVDIIVRASFIFLFLFIFFACVSKSSFVHYLSSNRKRIQHFSPSPLSRPLSSIAYG